MKNRLYIFGGYDGIQRLNDFYYFVLAEQKHHAELPSSTAPAPRIWIRRGNVAVIVDCVDEKNVSIERDRQITAS